MRIEKLPSSSRRSARYAVIGSGGEASVSEIADKLFTFLPARNRYGLWKLLHRTLRSEQLTAVYEELDDARYIAEYGTEPVLEMMAFVECAISERRMLS